MTEERPQSSARAMLLQQQMFREFIERQRRRPKNAMMELSSEHMEEVKQARTTKAEYKRERKRLRNLKLEEI